MSRINLDSVLENQFVLAEAEYPLPQTGEEFSSGLEMSPMMQ